MTIIATIDWETLGLEQDAPLLEMGYCIGDTSSASILSIGSITLNEAWNIRMDRRASYDTLAWWIRKAVDEPKLRNYLLSYLDKNRIEASIPPEQDTPSMCFAKFLSALCTHNVTQLWCTDKSFDYTFLNIALASFGFNLFRDTSLTYKAIYESRYLSEQSCPEEFKQSHEDLQNHTPIDDSIKLFRNLRNVIL